MLGRVGDKKEIGDLKEKRMNKSLSYWVIESLNYWVIELLCLHFLPSLTEFFSQFLK